MFPCYEFSSSTSIYMITTYQIIYILGIKQNHVNVLQLLLITIHEIVQVFYPCQTHWRVRQLLGFFLGEKDDALSFFRYRDSWVENVHGWDPSFIWKAKNIREFQRLPEKTQPDPPEANHPFHCYFRAAPPSLISRWGRSRPATVRSRWRGHFPFVFPFPFSLSSLVDYQIGRIWVTATATTPTISYSPFHSSPFRFGSVWWRSAGGYGWLESPSASLPFVSTNLPFQWAPRPSTAMDVQRTSDLGTSSSPSFYRPYFWVWLFKTLFEEPSPHSDRMAFLAMANSIRLSSLLGWNYDS